MRYRWALMIGCMICGVTCGVLGAHAWAAPPNGNSFAAGKGAAAAGKTAVVSLDKSRGWALHGESWWYRGLLGRELARQSFLLSAREELGCETRDVWLDEALDGANEPFDVVASGGAESLLEILRGSAPEQSSLWSRTLQAKAGKPFNFVALLEELEGFSRTDFVNLLKQQTGVDSPAPTAAAGQTLLPAEIEKLLGQMDVVAQFVALRRLHALGRDPKLSSARYGALARGYATLGLLTEMYWHPLHNVFKARAMLYAQRLVARSPKDPTALWHRAYTLSLAGLHAAALADFEQARLAAKGANASPPAWAIAAESHCRFDTRSLNETSKKAPEFELAHLLRAISFEYSRMPKVAVKNPSTVEASIRSHMAIVPAIAISAALEEANRLPHCARIAHGNQALRNGSQGAVTEGPKATPWRSNAYAVLASTPEAPRAVLAVLKDLGNQRPALGSLEEKTSRTKLIAALSESDGPSTELSWKVFARILLEESFLENLPDGNDEEFIPSDDRKAAGSIELAATEKLLEGHPYRTYLLERAGAKTEDPQLLAEMAKAVDLDALENKQGDLIRRLHRIDENLAHQCSIVRIERREDATGDFMQRHVIARFVDRDMQLLVGISPYSPLARAMMCDLHWDQVQAQAEQWEKDSVEQPGVLLALGMRYGLLNKLDDAQRCIEASIALEPGFKARLALAEVFKRRGEIERWVSTLEKLAKDPKGEEEMDVNVTLTSYFLQQRDLERARVYAEQAAAQRTRNGLLIASAVYEVMQDWEASEFWIEALAKQDLVRRCEWYFWCKRTGGGKVNEASQLAAAFMSDRQQGGDVEYFRWDIPGVYYLLNKDLDNARRMFEDEFERNHNPWSGLHAMLIADMQNDPTRRKALLEEIRTKGNRTMRQQRSQLITLAQWIADDLGRGGKAEFDWAAVEKLAATSTPLEQTNFYYVVAAYVDLHGDKVKALKYWRRCMLSGPINGLSRSLAGAALLDRASLPSEYKEAIQKPPRQPLAK